MNYRALVRKMTNKDKASYASSPPNMGWLRSVGLIELYASFAEYPLFYRSLLQKRPIILSILVTKATQQMYTAKHGSSISLHGSGICTVAVWGGYDTRLV